MSYHICGASLNGREKFCPNCGINLVVVSDASELTGSPEQPKLELAKQYAKVTARGAASVGQAAIKSKLGKEIAIGAGIGAALAIPVPFIGPLGGAVVGTGVVLYKRYWKS